MSLTKVTYSMIQSTVINVRDYGAVGDNSNNDTSAFQNAIDAAHAAYVGGQQLGGGNVVFIPEGRYKVGPLIIKNGVNLQGAGKLNTQLRLFGNNATLLAASANTSTLTSSGALYYGFFKDFAILSWEGANGQTPVNQVGWDAVGFSRWYCENMYFGWGAGMTGVRMTNAILAGSGGPANWYNTFVGCICEKHYSGAGGVGLLLGDTSSTKEQITTWNWIGGAVRGSGDGTGTGLNLQSGTGCTFYGVTFEAVQNAILLGSSAGSRFANFIDFIGCYWEGNTVNWNVYAGCVGISFSGGFVTGGTDIDNGSSTSYNQYGRNRANIVGATVNDYWQVTMLNGGVNRPEFISKSTISGVDLVDDLANNVTIFSSPQVSASHNYLSAYKNNLSDPLWESGTASFSPGDDNVKTLGRSSFRWSTVYAVTPTINTSDANQKQQVRPLIDKEVAVAKRLKFLIRAFKFNDAVAAKGDSARIHVGVIAQDVKAAFNAEGLDANAYGLFCSDTLEDGTERLGIRYEELLAFVIAAM